MPPRRPRHSSRNQAIRRYEKHRRRNLLASPGRFDFIIVLDHLKPGFNVAKIFRSAEAFGCHEMHLIDIGPFDPAPAKGALKQVPARFHGTFEACYQELQQRGYSLYTLQATAAQCISSVMLPQKSAFIFGHEELGLSFNPEAYAGIDALAIPQFGQVESLNVSVAASVVMYEYLRQSGFTPATGH